mmetsp:Transcript_26999/g.57199  ORF Transcript_26999/g.57199 Transcript_26999/m.57199 type:complete len:296 (-) Transcript_26999:663-1550(-)
MPLGEPIRPVSALPKLQCEGAGADAVTEYGTAFVEQGLNGEGARTGWCSVCALEAEASCDWNEHLLGGDTCPPTTPRSAVGLRGVALRDDCLEGNAKSTETPCAFPVPEPKAVQGEGARREALDDNISRGDREAVSGGCPRADAELSSTVHCCFRGVAVSEDREGNPRFTWDAEMSCALPLPEPNIVQGEGARCEELDDISRGDREAGSGGCPCVGARIWETLHCCEQRCPDGETCARLLLHGGKPAGEEPSMDCDDECTKTPCWLVTGNRNSELARGNGPHADEVHCSFAPNLE